MSNKNISTVDYTDTFNTFFVKDEDDIKQISKDNVKSVLGIGVVTGAIAESDSTLTLTDSIEKPFELHIYGKSTQDGTPTPENPIEIVSVENPTLTINNGADLSQTKQLNYLLRGIGDAKDELIIYADGSGKLIQRIGTITLKGAFEYFGVFLNLNLFYYDRLYDCNFKNQSKVFAISNGYKFVSNDEYATMKNYQARIRNTDGRLYVANDSFTNKDDFNTYLSNNSLTVVYELSTPIITELSAEQIDIILNTYNDTTNILTDQSAGIKAVYTADIKGYIDRKFDELATALVAQTSEQ